MEFLRFPRTPHLMWLGAGQPRDDKVLSPGEVTELLANPVIVEEKVDGANLGLSVGPNGEIRAQSRGSYLPLDSLPSQFKPLPRWVNVHREALRDALGSTHILFGEWCYAKHHIHYTRLPDWFLTFDVYDRSVGRFWSVDRRNALAETIGLVTVPELARGHFDLPSLKQILGPSRLTDGPAEGIYIRWERDALLERRAKLVRAEFTQAIGDHWTRAPLQPNRRAG